MRLHDIDQFTPNKKARRVGRGIAAGQGKTAGRGTKGQKSRTGANSNIPRTFEGAATGLIQRLPKLKGFKSKRIHPTTVSIDKLGLFFQNGDTINIISLLEKGIVTDTEAIKGVKIVGSGIEKEYNFTFDTTDSNLSISKQLLTKTTK